MKYITCLVAGFIAGILLVSIYQHKGLRGIEYSPPAGLKIDWSGDIQQVEINFGENPARRTLKEALNIVEDRTMRFDTARVYVDQDVLTSKFSSMIVQPPRGSHPSLSVLKQLFASANSSEHLFICIRPEGGYRIILK